MSNVIIMLHTDDYKDLDGTFYEVFLDREYIGAVGEDIYVLDRVIKKIGLNTIEEKVDLDTYLSYEERDIFYSAPNFFFTEEEQEAILKGEIDYAFDKIKSRLVKEVN